MVQQRQHSMPMRWVNSDRIDPAVLYTIMRGTWNSLIPVQGIGTNAIGAVDRAGMPQENWGFDKIAKQDITEAWGSGMSLWGGQPTDRANSKDGVDSRIARERAKVGKFFLGIAEVIGGLISIFEDPTSFGEGFAPAVS